MGETYQSLKAANLVRVDPGKAADIWGNRQNGGHTMMCPASAQTLQSDVYGRPANQNTLSVNLDAACGQGTQFNAQRHIQIENNNRPYIPVCSAGLRGGGDAMGVGRDLQPRDLYGSGQRGNMVRHYSTKNNLQWDPPIQQEYPNYYWRVEQPWTGSMDATKSAYYHA